MATLFSPGQICQLEQKSTKATLTNVASAHTTEWQISNILGNLECGQSVAPHYEIFGVWKKRGKRVVYCGKVRRETDKVSWNLQTQLSLFVGRLSVEKNFMRAKYCTRS